MCDIPDGSEALWYFGIRIFFLVWTIAVPVVITTRLERIIKLLEESKKENR